MVVIIYYRITIAHHQAEAGLPQAAAARSNPHAL